MQCIAKAQAFNVIPSDDCHSLKEACESPDWPEWEKVIQTELEQLQRMGTWKLVNKPVGTVPIANKWVFYYSSFDLSSIYAVKYHLTTCIRLY